MAEYEVTSHCHFIKILHKNQYKSVAILEMIINLGEPFPHPVGKAHARTAGRAFRSAAGGERPVTVDRSTCDSGSFDL